MSEKILRSLQIVGNSPLIKIQSLDILKSTQNGLLYMNSLKHYRELYVSSKDDAVGDPNEGKLFIHEATFEINGESQTCKDEWVGTANQDDFVYCMFGIDHRKHSSFCFTDEQKEKLTAFNDYALVITNVEEFKERVKHASQARGFRVKDGFVDYYSTTYDDVERLITLVCGMDNIVFYKTDHYAYQQEYRFTIPNFHNTAKKEHLEVNIGSIKDISEIITTKELFSSRTVRHIPASELYLADVDSL